MIVIPAYSCRITLAISLYSCRNKPKIPHNIGQHVLPIVSQAVDIINKIKVFDLFWSFGVQNSYGFWVSDFRFRSYVWPATVSGFHYRPTYCLPLWRFVGSYVQGVSWNKSKGVLTWCDYFGDSRIWETIRFPWAERGVSVRLSMPDKFFKLGLAWHRLQHGFKFYLVEVNW